MSSRQVRANFENIFRHFSLRPQTRGPVFFQMAIQFLRRCSEHLAVENMLRDGMRPFRTMERSKPN